jgi:hypothetical protein
MQWAAPTRFHFIVLYYSLGAVHNLYKSVADGNRRSNSKLQISELDFMVKEKGPPLCPEFHQEIAIS